MFAEGPAGIGRGTPGCLRHCEGFPNGWGRRRLISATFGLFSGALVRLSPSHIFPTRQRTRQLFCRANAESPALARLYCWYCYVFQWLRGPTAAVNCQGRSAWCDCLPPSCIGVNVWSTPGLRKLKVLTSTAWAPRAFVFDRVFKIVGKGYVEPSIDF